ncbi:hypothetical protein CHUAL_012820 [Chamberlinius hualienensis]
MDKPLLDNEFKKKSSNYYTLPNTVDDLSLRTITVHQGSNNNENSVAGKSTKELRDALIKERDVEHPTSNFETIIHILKGNIGTGVLALPQAFIYSGLAFGTVGLMVIAAICIHCMQLVLQCSQKLCLKSGIPSMDYATTAEYAFRLGPRRHQWFARWGRLMTNIFICITQFGFCIVYWVFVATNIQTAVLFFKSDFDWDYRIYMAILFLPIAIASFVSNLKYLAPLMIAANIFEIAAFGMLFYYLFQEVPSVDSRRQLPSLGDLPLWFGTVIYAFEGIALVLPLENNMRRPQDMPGCLGVLNASMAIVTLWYVAVAFFGYLKYGDELKGSITLSLPPEILSVVIQIAYAAGILFSIMLQFYVPFQIMWPSIREKVVRHPKIWEGAFRMVLILFIFGLGALIPEFELYISLVGAFGGSYLSLIFPIVIHMITFWEDGMPWYIIAKDIIIIVVGILGFVVGTYTSILSIIQAFQNE